MFLTSKIAEIVDVSTHSRLKAAGIQRVQNAARRGVSTHSRLKAAGCGKGGGIGAALVSTHSRLKAAGAVAQIK